MFSVEQYESAVCCHHVVVFCSVMKSKRHIILSLNIVTFMSEMTKIKSNKSAKVFKLYNSKTF